MCLNCRVHRSYASGMLANKGTKRTNIVSLGKTPPFCTLFMMDDLHVTLKSSKFDIFPIFMLGSVSSIKASRSNLNVMD